MSSEFCSFLSSSHKAVLHGESEACLVYRKFLSWVHPMLFPLPTHLSLEGKRRFLLVFLLHPSVSLCFHHIIFHVFIPNAIGLLWINCSKVSSITIFYLSPFPVSFILGKVNLLSHLALFLYCFINFDE